MIGTLVRLIGLARCRFPISRPLGAAGPGHLQRIRPTLGSQPAYVVLTSALLLCLGGATNALARLIPR